MHPYNQCETSSTESVISVMKNVWSNKKIVQMLMFALQQKFGRETIIKSIGVGAGKFLGVRRIYARISSNMPEKFLCDFCLQILSHNDHEDLFWYDLQKRGFSYIFLQMLSAIF